VSNKPQLPPAAAAGELSHRAMQQAAEWYALLGSEDASASERLAWRAWLERAAEHRLAWDYVESVSGRFAQIKSVSDPRRIADSLWKTDARMRQRRKVLAGLSGLAAAGLLGWGTWHHTQLPLLAQTWRADYRSATGQTRELQLPDGSRLWLNTATAVNQDYAARQRRLHLLEGEILIDTAADPSRPFTVQTSHGLLTALGTRFSVRLDHQRVLLAVYKGAVEIRTRQGTQAILQARQQASFGPQGIGTLQPADPAREAWHHGVLVAKDITLGELVAELRRYRHGHLGLAPEVADLRVFGNFPLNDTDATLDMLAGALPVHIRRTLPWWVSIEPDSV